MEEASNCFSECLQKPRPFHSLGVADWGETQCIDCKAFATTKARIINCLKQRFPQNWEHKLYEFLKFKREVKRKMRSYRKHGYAMAETIYFIDPPFEAELHSDHIRFPGQHIISKNEDALYKKYPLLKNYKGTIPKVSFLTEYGNHE